MNHGFRLAYCKDEEHAKGCVEHKQGVFYSDRLDEIREEVERKWIMGGESRIPTNIAHKESSYSETHYFDGSGNFATFVDRLNPYEPSRHVTFVSKTEDGLLNLLQGFKLRFDVGHIRTDGGV